MGETTVFIVALLIPGLFSFGIFALTAYFVRQYLGETPKGLRRSFDELVQETQGFAAKQRAEQNEWLELLADERERIQAERKRLTMAENAAKGRDKKREAQLELEGSPDTDSIPELHRRARSLGLIRG